MEQILVVERSGFFRGQWPEGFTPIPDPRPLLTRFEAVGFFVPRPEAEDNPAWKQPIPYCLVTQGEQLFTVRRTRGQSERRLHGLWSIGLGGHVQAEDRGSGPLFENSLRRELEEELAIPGLDRLQPRFLGLLNDDSNPVGRVHVGLVYRLEVPSPRAPGSEPLSSVPRQKSVRIRETSKMTGGFRSLVGSQNLWQDRSRFETWSRILLEALVLPGGRGMGAPMHLGDQGREETHG